MAIGIHPEHAGKNPMVIDRAIRRMSELKKNKVVHAIGEMGFDFTKTVSLYSQENLMNAQSTACHYLIF